MKEISHLSTQCICQFPSIYVRVNQTLMIILHTRTALMLACFKSHIESIWLSVNTHLWSLVLKMKNNAMWHCQTLISQKDLRVNTWTTNRNHLVLKFSFNSLLFLLVCYWESIYDTLATTYQSMQRMRLWSMYTPVPRGITWAQSRHRSAWVSNTWTDFFRDKKTI